MRAPMANSTTVASRFAQRFGDAVPVVNQGRLAREMTGGSREEVGQHLAAVQVGSIRSAQQAQAVDRRPEFRHGVGRAMRVAFASEGETL